jgi:hypothetical protein
MKSATQQMKHQGIKSGSTKLCICLLLCTFLYACSKDKTFEEVSPVQLNVIHASVDFGSMNISNNGNSLFTNLNLGDFSAYQSIDKINSILSLSRSTTSKLDRTLAFNQFGKFSLVVVDSFSKLQTIMLSNDTTSLDLNKAAIRFINCSSLMPNVQLRFVYKDSIALHSRFYTDLLANPSTVAMYKSVDTGTYKFDLYKAIRTNVDSFVLRKPNVRLQTGKRYTAFTIGKIGGVGADAFSLKIVED